jgi:EAL domain-containing protein (putative c-di-GMP-specific phosphodiesterase class I)
MGALGASGAVAKQGAESDASGRGLVLLVDDEQSIARAYARTLGAAGFAVEIAFDGKEAAAAAKERNFDVIVSDIAMPEMSGLELLRAVREHDLDVPFVLMTGGPAVDSAVRAVEYGALRYLIKPVSTAELEEVVARAVRLHQMARIKREALEMFRLDGKHLGDRAGLEARFASALSSLWIAYQPIVSWSKRSTFAHEALVRNEEPTLRSPPDLFEAAERLGRLEDLGRIVRDRVAQTLDVNPVDGLLFINLHAMELADDRLVSSDAPLSRHAGRVVLEVTERAPLEQIRDATSRVAQLRALGYRIAVDDLALATPG